jgi:hypothetical protein
VAFTYRLESGLIVLQILDRAIPEIGRGCRMLGDRCRGVWGERGFFVDNPVDPVTVMANAFAIKQGFALRGITLHATAGRFSSTGAGR